MRIKTADRAYASALSSYTKDAWMTSAVIIRQINCQNIKGTAGPTRN